MTDACSLPFIKNASARELNSQTRMPLQNAPHTHGERFAAAACSNNHTIDLRAIKESIEDVLQQFLTTAGVACHFALLQH